MSDDRDERIRQLEAELLQVRSELVEAWSAARDASAREAEAWSEAAAASSREADAHGLRVDEIDEIDDHEATVQRHAELLAPDGLRRN